MMRRTPPSLADDARDSLVSVSDVVIALARLRPRNAHARVTLLRLLGFDAAAASRPPSGGRSRTRRQPAGRPGSAPSAVPSKPSTPGGPRERLQPVRTEPPPSETSLQALPRADARTVQQAPPPDPLFEPRWTRDIVVNALATSAEVGAYDIDELVTLLARGKPVVEIPRQRAQTLFRGAHVLVDIGEPMEPFAADQEQLVTVIRRVVGEDLVDVRSFRRTPANGCGSGPLWTWSPYQPPRTVLPLVLLTDLGIGGSTVSTDRASEQEWLRFFSTVPEELPIIVLNPYPPRRWPAALTDRAVILQWDRVTSPRVAWLARVAAERRR